MSSSDSDPLVSIIIATYERRMHAENSIDTSIQQTYQNVEIIVVEDGSNSGIEDLLAERKNIRIKYNRHPERRGIAAARNTGTKMSKGKYIAFLDDDDKWSRDKIALQVSLAEESNERDIMIYCGGDRRDNTPQEVNDYTSKRGLMADYIFNGLTLSSSSMLVRRESLLSIEGHSEDLVSCVDHDLWFKMARSNFVMDYVPRKLVSSNTVDTSMMNRLDERLMGIQQFFEKWKDYVTSNHGRDSWIRIEKIYHDQIVGRAHSQYMLGRISYGQAVNYLRRIYNLQSINFSLLDKLLFAAGKLHLTPVKRKKKNICNSLLSFRKSTAE